MNAGEKAALISLGLGVSLLAVIVVLTREEPQECLAQGKPHIVQTPHVSARDDGVHTYWTDDEVVDCIKWKFPERHEKLMRRIEQEGAGRR